MGLLLLTSMVTGCGTLPTNSPEVSKELMTPCPDHRYVAGNLMVQVVEADLKYVECQKKVLNLQRIIKPN